MAPKKKVEEEPAEAEVPEEPAEPPPPPEDEVTELSTGLVLPLRPKDVGRLWALDGDHAAQADLLLQLMEGLTNAYPAKEQRGIVVDFHLFNLAHAKSVCLSQKQAAVFHAVMGRILAMMRLPEPSREVSPKQMPCDVTACFQEFQRLLLAHAVEAPPERLGIFAVSEAKLLTDYASSTLFKHILLYQFCVNFERESQTIRFVETIRRPPAVPDLTVAAERPPDEPCSGAAGAEGGEAAGEAGEGAAGEKDEDDDEIKRLVQEKLRETEAQLQAKLDAREQAFRDKLALKQTAKE
eukprot:CAMPEP_0195104388 /NCGR_PEP_ID=MMETSP0448-20130528/73073_1 /TAXON_ID=66468 /ORGANISM="Heterocapsa triquestra, Strain CCMP 448" /LENGTH=294 /DNA_ID=CAMNT_0040140221 /DNA_START=11 /DNA_END=893 /DNA_ORIENTATION=+